MKYKYGSRRRALEYEKDIVEYWKKNRTFEKSVEQRPEDASYVFYDGPPFITGNPHHGTLLSSIVKDAVPRYWTMKGRRVERRWGWDCHGLPAENFTEKHLGGTVSRKAGGAPGELELKIGDKTEAITLEKYIETARELMVANSETWESTVDRIGRWVDFKGAYKTMDKDFMESVWWAFNELYEKGKIYEGEKVLMYDTAFGTPVSKNEVTMDNDAYQTVTDPSVFVKFKLADEEGYLLAWTTTPWTLPGNTALAVNPEMDYVTVLLDGDRVTLAKKLVEKVLTDEKHQPVAYEVVGEMKGAELVGKRYVALFPDCDMSGAVMVNKAGDADKIHQVYGANFVEGEAGTGIVHVAPAYGEDDYELAKSEGFAGFDVLDEGGVYLAGMPYEGLEVFANNKMIAKDLKEKGVVWKIEYIQHEYPFNPRSKQRIMYRAIPSWFFDIQGSKDLMIEQNDGINWFPEHLKEGRFKKNIEQAPDWNLSRDRFWATAMPVWKGDRGSIRVVGSYAELKELSGVELKDYHRPWVDAVEFDIDGEHFVRVDKVLDCWFESGSMPFAQLHYPFENKEKFEANYPADFIVEYVGQVRAWFYYVHAVNTALFGTNAYKNVITTGVVAGNDGRKMSKSLGNFTDPNELMDKFSADSLRYLLLSSPLLSGEDFALLDKDVSDVARKLAMIWNVYDFFTMYAEVDGWDSEGAETLVMDDLKNPLDRWIVSRAHQLTEHITKNMDVYNVPDAMSAILPFVDDLSNWFVRRSRRRFWKAQDDGDKAEAYQTLHYVLVRLSMLLAPFTPFLAEELYRQLTGGESVHLLDWPETGDIDVEIIEKMRATRKIIEIGLMQRMTGDEYGQIKVRQPLAGLVYASGTELGGELETVIAEEVNVKQVTRGFMTDGDDKPMTPGGGEYYVALDKVLTDELRAEGYAREVIRVVQAARKNAGLNVDDRIRLSLSVELAPEHAQMVADEVLAVEVTVGGNYAHDEVAKVDGGNVTISLEKAE
jgi:isoleucyl-tRNA synthetase